MRATAKSTVNIEVGNPIARAVWTTTVRATFTPGDARIFETLATDGVPLNPGTDDAALTRAAREALLAGA